MQQKSKNFDRFFKINAKLNQHLSWLGLEDYSKQECKIYWKKINKKEIDISKDFYRSVEQVHKYRYFININRKTRIFVLRTLRNIYANYCTEK